MTTAKAIATGHLTVTVPVLIVVVGSGAAGAFYLGPPGGLAGTLLGCCLLAWPIWAWTVSRWRRWSADRVDSPQQVQRLAVATGLIGPRGSVVEQAEKTLRVPLIWGSLAAALAALAAFVVVISKGSAPVAIGFMAFGFLCIAAAIAYDLRRSDSTIARIGIGAGLLAAASWLLLPRIGAPAWVSVATVTFTSVWAVCLITLLAWIPAEFRNRLRWMSVGIVGISAISLIASYAAAAGISSRPAQRSPMPGIAIASPKVTATWASFTTGTDKPHRATADGLQITDVDTGSGAEVRSGDVLTVRYIMWLSDGKQVDSSDAFGSPFKFTLGTGIVIQGWDEGVPGMAVGGIRRLVIPPSLAYGDRGAANESGAYVVPPNATLVFVVQLLSSVPNT